MSSPHQIRITDAEDAALEEERVTFKTPATPGKRKVSASWLLSPPSTDSSPSSGGPSPADLRVYLRRQNVRLELTADGDEKKLTLKPKPPAKTSRRPKLIRL
jgi:hypothetical protein